MELSLTWSDLVKLAANRVVEKGGVELTIDKYVLPDLEVAPDGSSGFVRFTRDAGA